MRCRPLNWSPRGFIQVNQGKKFDHNKTCTLTGTFKIFIAARVDPGISPPNYHFWGTKNDIYLSDQWQG